MRNGLARFVLEVFPCRNFWVFVPLQLVNENKEEIVQTQRGHRGEENIVQQSLLEREEELSRKGEANEVSKRVIGQGLLEIGGFKRGNGEEKRDGGYKFRYSLKPLLLPIGSNFLYFSWKLTDLAADLADQASISPVQFQAEEESMKVENISDSFDHLLEDNQDDEDDSDGEQEIEQDFAISRPVLLVESSVHANLQETINFKSMESDLDSLSASGMGPSDDLENIDDLNVLSETSNNKDNYGTSCIMINDTLNETTSTAEVLKEISDKMTDQLLEFFGSESPLAIPTSQSVPSSHQRASENVPNQKASENDPHQKASENVSNFGDNYQQPKKRGQKRLLPSWMKVGNVDAKHFKVDLAEEEKQKKEKISADEFTAAVRRINLEFNASCDLCNFRDPNRKNVMKHRNAEHRGALFQCRQCGKTVKSPQSLVNHRNNSHMEMLVREQRYP